MSVRACIGLVAAVTCVGPVALSAQPATAPGRPAEGGTITLLAETKRLVDKPDERVSILDNGLSVILKAHRTAPVACVQMYCKTGSIYEQEYLGAGMSHLFEHLLHGSATQSRSEEQSREILDRIGGNTNAYTSYDATCYFINTDNQHAPQAVNLLSDWITHPTFPQAAFDREWGVVQRELERDEDDPDRQLDYLMMDTLYRVHPARYPIIGYKPVVQALKKDDIVGYYQRMYVPDNIVVTIVGDIDLGAMLDVVRREFASFQRRRVPTIVLPEEPPMSTPRSATRSMRVQSAMLRMAWPSIPLTHPDLFALDVLSFILTEGESSRLARTIRDAGLTFSIESSSWTPHWANGNFVIAARLAPDKLESAEREILKQVAAVGQEPVSAEELDKAKKQKAAEHVFHGQTAESVASMMSNDFIATGDVHFSQAYVDKIQKVTAEQVREVARKYLVPERLATITVLPESGPSATAKQEPAAHPDPVRQVALDNGLRCLIRRDPTTPLVAMQAFSLGGVLFEDEKTNGLSRLASLLITRGTPDRSAQQIAEFFDARGGTLQASSGNNAMYCQAEVLKADFAEAMAVFADVVTRPTFPQEELELFRPQLLDAIAQISESWRTELFSYARHKFYQNSPYQRDELGSRDVVSKATRDDVASFYKKLVTGPNTVLAIYGDVDPAMAESLVRRYFGSMSGEKVPLPRVAPEPALGAPKLFVLAKSAERKAAGVGLGYAGMRVTDKQDRVRMAVLDTIVSGYRYPTGWLHESLRGGTANFVYEVHAVNVPGVVPGVFQIYAACQPEKVNQVCKIIQQQLAKARSGEFTEEELATAKAIIVTSELMDNQTNASRAMQDSLNELYGLGIGFDEEFVEAVKKVTLDDVRGIARKYLTDPIMVVVTPSPEQVDIGIKPVVERQPESAAAGKETR